MATEDVLSARTAELADGACIRAVIVTYNMGQAIHRCFDCTRQQVARIALLTTARMSALVGSRTNCLPQTHACVQAEAANRKGTDEGYAPHEG